MKEIKFNFEDLIVYQRALDYVDFVYKICDSFPSSEKYILANQYLRAANSIPLNIAEGAGASDAQFNRYLQIALNSAKECVVCSTLAMRRDYISSNMDQNARQQLEEICKMITGLQKSLKKTNH
ncbi:four helix bundle protein [Aquimarina brevivitae]|uniref:Four helix bundle protein n=1 Tax=Aquimarina brevivitae TaxID=323412 RepID=A0A4Q7NZV2_9FLAO|nr:four helix bundle protein [Aquimarina brevivitae]RZS92590.1 four helix bundle protein [Aquimarina brevivitae]